MAAGSGQVGRLVAEQTRDRLGDLRGHPAPDVEGGARLDGPALALAQVDQAHGALGRSQHLGQVAHLGALGRRRLKHPAAVGQQVFQLAVQASNGALVPSSLGRAQSVLSALDALGQVGSDRRASAGG